MKTTTTRLLISLSFVCLCFFQARSQSNSSADPSLSQGINYTMKVYETSSDKYAYLEVQNVSEQSLTFTFSILNQEEALVQSQHPTVLKPGETLIANDFTLMIPLTGENQIEALEPTFNFIKS